MALFYRGRRIEVLYFLLLGKWNKRVRVTAEAVDFILVVKVRVESLPFES